MCLFVGYKYGGGGYWVWDLRRHVVVESRDIVFFEDGLPQPTLGELQSTDADEPTAHPVPIDVAVPLMQLTSALQVAPKPVSLSTVPPAVAFDHVPMMTSHPCLTICLPGRQMNEPPADDHSKSLGDGQPHGHDGSGSDGHDDSGDDTDSPMCPVNDVSFIPDYPARSTHSSLMRYGGGGVRYACSASQ